ncbi:MAG: GTP-binding protein [Halanaerobiales bacterium]
MLIHNIGILAHVDAGKTTITEYMLYLAGVKHSIGRVDDGTASTDWLEVEKRRGISVRSASTSFTYKNSLINLIDTPGHVDFSGEIERSLRVLDGAVLVISAAEGIESQSEILWQALRTLDIPTIIFINKIDRRASNIEKINKQLRKTFSGNIIPLQMVRDENTKSPQLIDYLNTKENNAVPVDSNISNNILYKPEANINSDGTDLKTEGLLKYQQMFYEFIAERDEDLMEKYINEEPITLSEMRKNFKKKIAASSVYPLIYGSAINGVGVEQLLDTIVKYLPAADVDREGHLAGLVYKLDHDPVIGKMAHLRLYSGTIKTRDTVYNQSRDVYEKVTQLKKAYVDKYEDIAALKSGDIGIVCGLKQTYIGDMLGDSDYVPADYRIANPLLKVEVKPEGESQISDLISALKELEEEDPLLNMEWLREKREVHIKIMGIIQLEILETILKERFNLQVSFGMPSVIYKETPLKKGEGFVRYTMPKPCWAVLHFQIEPGERGSGLVYKSEVRPDVLPIKYQKQVERTMPEALDQGLYGWEVTDLKVTLIDGEYHIEHTHAPDFMVATPMGIMDGLSNTGTSLLEPIYWFHISVPEDLGGRILGDLIEMRAEYENPFIKNGKFIVEGTIPAATSLDYSIKLSSISGGRGIIKTRFEGYRKCPVEEGATCPRKGINPLDRSKYILSVRNAL